MDGPMDRRKDGWTELGRFLANCNSLLIPDYMTKIVVSNVIRYITHFR